MKKNGFTLIELLAVITILALVSLITSISVSNMVKESKDELSETQMNLIKAAAKSWGADNTSDLPTGNSCSYITLNDLKEYGLLDSNIIDPKGKNKISNDLKIKIISNLNEKGKSVITYEVNSKNINNCIYIGSPIYVDIPEGLTPVVYDESKETWRVPELNEEWYNYDEQMWANAVVLGKGKTKKPGEEVTVEGDNPEALMMLVYIPRYEYRIINTVGTYGTHTATGEPGTQDTPGEIEVKFINNSQTKSDNDYILHPAFNFDGIKSGFWVGKFELSSISTNTDADNNLGCNQDGCATNAISNLRILPNVSSLRSNNGSNLSSNNVSNFFYAIRGIESDTTFGLTNMDTHMIKNSEWGAVAYLSQSKYGKYGNNDYDNKYKEIYQNKSSYITGSSNGTPSQGNYRSGGQCAYNDMQDLGVDEDNNKKGQCGPGASTTGNIYGVYDMSGGSNEYVMGVYGPEYPTIGQSGFTPSDVFTSGTINPKYYDVYKNETNSNDNDATRSCDEGVCYGHALSETSGWYGDNKHMVTSNYPWFLRGGYCYDSTSGVFSYIDHNGNSFYDYSARVVGFGK